MVFGVDVWCLVWCGLFLVVVCCCGALWCVVANVVFVLVWFGVCSVGLPLVLFLVVGLFWLTQIGSAWCCLVLL